MKTSESIIHISKALVAAQKSIEYAVKDKMNPHLKNKYADLGAVIEAVKPALNSNGIVFLQSASPSETAYVYVTTRLLHESGEWLEDTATVPMDKINAQGYGSAMTYARRYSLAALTGLYQEDDDGNAATRKMRRNTGKSDAGEKSKITPTAGAFDALSEELQSQYMRIAADIQEMFEANTDSADQEALAYVNQETSAMDADQKTALWSLLPSHVRSKIKRMNAELRNKQ